MKYDNRCRRVFIVDVCRARLAKLVGRSRLFHFVPCFSLCKVFAMNQKICGYFYWTQGLRGPVSERIPIDSGTPAPKTYLLKQPLKAGEMNLKMLILEARYPYYPSDGMEEK